MQQVHEIQNLAKQLFDTLIGNDTKHDWKVEEVIDLFNLPFNDLIFKAAQIHRANHNQNAVQISTLLSIKTGSCPENCKFIL